jgi:excisionase family DNA binding protein
MNDFEVLTPDEVAEILKLTGTTRVQTVRRLFRMRRIRAQKVGRYYRTTRQAVADYLNGKSLARTI